MRQFLRVILVSAVAWGCSKSSEKIAADGGQDAGPPNPPVGVASSRISESEPNDTPETAQRLDRSAAVAGEIQAVQPATKPDEDWYLIQPAELPQDVSIELVDATAGGSPAGKFVLEVYDRAHDRIASKTGELAHDPISPELASLATLRVRDALYVRVAGQPFHYALRVELKAPDPDAEAEPNNRAVDATPLALDHPIHGSYATEADQDYYVIEWTTDAGAAVVDAGAPASLGAPDASIEATADASTVAPSIAPNLAPTEMLRIEVTGVPGVRHSLKLLDDSQSALGSFNSREAGDPLFVRDVALRPGLSRVYVLLESWHGRKKAALEIPPGQAYTLTVHREAAPPDLELEPNDTLDLATPLAVRSAFPSGAPPSDGARAMARRVGYLAPAGDVDDYRLHLEAPTRVHLSLSALESVDSELSVVEPETASASGKTLLKVNEGGTKEPEVIPAIVLPAGDHIVRVQAAAHQVGTKWVRDQADLDHTYELTAVLAPDDGNFEREPNDTPATATPIAPAQPLSGYAFPAKDIDVYRLDLSNQPVAAGVTIHLTAVAKVPLALELHEAKEAKLGELLNTSDPGKAGLDAQIQQKLDPGVYYLVVKPRPPSHDPGVPLADPDAPYRLSVQLE
jgi:hypothetical protein